MKGVLNVYICLLPVDAYESLSFSFLSCEISVWGKKPPEELAIVAEWVLPAEYTDGTGLPLGSLLVPSPPLTLF